jgi:hypothetical protein
MIGLALSVLFLYVAMTSFVFAGTGLYTTTNGYVGQSPYTNLCWAASSVSMVQTKNINTDINTHVTKAIGSFSDVTRTRANIASDFNAIYSINATLTGTYGFSSVQAYMASNKPIYAGINWNIGGGHGAVISGTDSSINSLRIMDPFYGWQYPSYSTFLSNYQSAGYWSQSIYFN